MNNEQEIINSEQAEQLKATIGEAELIIIGAGSGLSASSGLDYGDSEIFNARFPGYSNKYGLQTISEAFFFSVSYTGRILCFLDTLYFFGAV